MRSAGSSTRAHEVLRPLDRGGLAHLEAWGVPEQRIAELDWWETHRLKGAELSVTAAPSQHFSGRGLHDRNATLWSSMVIRSSRHAVFFSGDTGLTTEYAMIREREGPTLLTLAANQGVRLLMPQLGEPVEPAHGHELTPWWRAVDQQPPRRLRSEPPVIKLPQAMPWPFD